MSEDKKSLIDLVPDSVDNAVKNITDKPTQNMGTTLADIWYLVFGGISQAADKKKLKYSYALQKMEEELKEDIFKIPENKLVEPDIQVIAQALEAAKYCVEKEELRHMFVKLITSSLNEDLYDDVHPIYINIIRSLTPFDAQLLLSIYNKNFECNFNFGDIIYSLNILSQLGLLLYDHNFSENESANFLEKEKVGNQLILKLNFNIPVDKIPNISFTGNNGEKINPSSDELIKFKELVEKEFIHKIHLTKLGYSFIQTCL